MTAPVYRQLCAVMQARRGPYAGIDIPEFYAMAETLFTPEEAAVNNAMPKTPATAADIAATLQQDAATVSRVLEAMADKGLCATFVAKGMRHYQAVPFMPGIFEFQFMSGDTGERATRIAHLIGAYKKAWKAAKGTKPIGYPLTRVIPVERTIAAGNTVHTYHQVATYIDRYDTIGVGACFCRHAAKLRGEDVHDMPMQVCMWFGHHADYMIERLGGRKVSRQEAHRLLDQAEQAGLVHMSRNTAQDIDFICNCDRWHCEVVTEVLQQPKPAWVFNSGFAPVFDPDRCIACETCLGRCPSQALAMGPQSLPQVDMDRCFGCAVCATGCAQQAIAMTTRPEIAAPPKDVRELVAAVKASAAS